MIIKKQLSNEFSKQLFNDFSNNLAFRAMAEVLDMKESMDNNFDAKEYLKDFISEWTRGSSENTTEQINGLGLGDLKDVNIDIEDVAHQSSFAIREVKNFVEEILGVNK
jgi:hypothetical protein